MYRLKLFIPILFAGLLWQNCLKNPTAYTHWGSQKIVFAIKNNFDAFEKLHTIHTDGSGLRTLETDSCSNYGNLVWINNSQSVLFTRNVIFYGTKPIILYKWDIHSSRKDSFFTLNGSQLDNLQWNQNSGELLFSCELPDSFYTQICKLSLNDKQLTCLTTSENDHIEPSWSPNRSRIAYYSTFHKPGIYIMNNDGSAAKKLVSTSRSYLCGKPVWSDDGSKIFFIKSETYSDDYYFIYSYNLQSDQIDTLFSNRHSITGLTYASNRAQLFFRMSDSTFNTPQLYMLNMNDKTIQRITYDPFLYGGKWLNSLAQIVLLSAIDGYDNFYTLKTDGSGFSQISYFRDRFNIKAWALSP